VLYKYLNPHLLVIAVANPAQSLLTMYLIDNVSGQILHQSKHQSVDISKGVKTHIVENIVYWSYSTTGDAISGSRGTRISVAELYESPYKNSKYNTYVNLYISHSTEWSSFDEKVPHVIAQTYLFDQPVAAMTTTSTRHGITSRDLLVATTNSLLTLPKRLLDPRRPILPNGAKLTAEDKEEGLPPYDAIIPDEKKWTISHINEVSPLSYDLTG
jgi:hypothetical protein